MKKYKYYWGDEEITEEKYEGLWATVEIKEIYEKR